MKIAILKVSLLGSILLGSVAPALAQQSWENLRRLQFGDRIQVVDQKLKSLTGTFLGVSDEAITFQVGQDEVGVQRTDVFRISSRERSKRGRNAIIGAAIGATAGLALGAAYCHGDCDLARGIAWGFPIMLGTGIGAGIGAALPAHLTIYRADRREE